MFLSINNPVYNTVIVFSIIMILVIIIKPDVIYDSTKKEFRQFGTTAGKTLMPIYVIGILIAMLLYIFFYYLSTDKSSNKTENIIYNNPIKNDQYYIQQQQQQINYLQNQLNQIMHNQVSSQINNIIQKEIKS